VADGFSSAGLCEIIAAMKNAEIRFII